MAATELQLLLLDEPGRMLAVLVADAAQHHPQPNVIRPGRFLLVRFNQLPSLKSADPEPVVGGAAHGVSQAAGGPQGHRPNHLRAFCPAERNAGHPGLFGRVLIIAAGAALAGADQLRQLIQLARLLGRRSGLRR